MTARVIPKTTQAHAAFTAAIIIYASNETGTAKPHRLHMIMR